MLTAPHMHLDVAVVGEHVIEGHLVLGEPQLGRYLFFQAGEDVLASNIKERPSMMYYDRTISDDLLDAAKPGGALGWLVPWVCSDPETRIDFRREDGQRKHGGLQVYVDQTRPIEFLGRGGGKVRLTAGKAYPGGIFRAYESHRRPKSNRE